MRTLILLAIGVLAFTEQVFGDINPLMSLDFSGLKDGAVKDVCGNFNAQGAGMLKPEKGNAASFDGLTSYVKITPEALNFSPPPEYSVELCFTPSGKQTNKYPKLLAFPNSCYLHITKEPPFTLCLNLFNTSGKFCKQLAVGGIPADEACHVFFTIGKNEAKLYVNGKLKESYRIKQNISPLRFPLMIGNRDSNSINGIYSGTVNGLALYSGTANAEEAAQAYENGKNGFLRSPGAHTGSAHTKKTSPAPGASAQNAWNAEWICGGKESSKEMSSEYFRKKFSLGNKIKKAQLKVTADDRYHLYINGRKIAAEAGWVVPELYNVTADLHAGENIIAVKTDNFMGPSGLLLELTVTDTAGTHIIKTDSSWKCAAAVDNGQWASLQYPDTKWQNAFSKGKVPARPWGKLQSCRDPGENTSEQAPPLARTLEMIKREKAPEAKVEMANGVPTLFINGKQRFPMLGKDIHLDRKFVNEYSRNGIHLYIPSWPYVGLQANSKYDYSELDCYALTVLSADPDAYMMFFVTLNTLDFWNKLNPDELCRFSDGSGAKQSLASEKWKKDYGAALEKFIEHIEKSPYGKRVFGLIVDATMSEWQYWGVENNKFPDYSLPVQKGFRLWLENKYKNVAALRKAWGRNDIKTFSEINIPSEKERNAGGSSVFLEPGRQQAVIDYLTYHSEFVADAIKHFSGIVKRKTAGKMLCGSFYGYLLEHAGMRQRLQHGGHLALHKVLECPHIDFVASPVSYRLRRLGTCGAYMIPKGSVYLHKKMLFHEADIRTFLSSRNNTFSRTANLDDTLSVLKREFAKTLTDGIGLWWFDMRGGWFSDNGILNFFKNAARIGNAALAAKSPAKSEIAVIVDEKTPCRMSLTTGNILNNELISMQRDELSKIGAPFDVFLLSDLLAGKLPDYKMYIFLNPFYLSVQAKQLIKQKLQNNNRTILWLYAPGFAGENGLSVKSCSELTGMNLKLHNSGMPLKINLLTNELKSCKPGNSSSYGMQGKISPVFSIADPAVKVWGKLPDGSPGAGVKKLAGWTSIYSAAPRVPSWLIRNIAKNAGIFIYSESDDVVFAGRDYLVIHTAKPGMKKLKFPQKCDWHEVFEKKFYGKNTASISFKADKYKTFIFKLTR